MDLPFLYLKLKKKEEPMKEVSILILMDLPFLSKKGKQRREFEVSILILMDLPFLFLL